MKRDGTNSSPTTATDIATTSIEVDTDKKSIKYVSDEALRQKSESKALQTAHGYWQRLKYQMCVSKNGKYLSILFDRYCIIRGCDDKFMADMYRIALPLSFWEYTQYRYLQWSADTQLFAISSFSKDIIIYNDKGDQILAFNCANKAANAMIVGLVWRKYERHFWELIILFSDGALYHRSVEISHGNVINFEKHTRITHVQYPHTSIRKWVYDAMDYVDGAPNPYLVISCIPKKLLDTKPRQTRLGHAVMVLGFNNDTANQANLECVAKIGNTREMSYGSYPSNERIYAMQ